MKTPPGYLIVAFTGIGLYALAAFAPLILHPNFWTTGTLGSEIPWYFMGQTFIEGVSAAVALVLCAVLGVVAARKLGPAAWGALMPAFLFLSTQLGRGVAVLLHSRRIWAGPEVAETDWLTFADYASGTSRAQVISLAIALAVLLGVHLLGRRRIVAERDEFNRG